MKANCKGCKALNDGECILGYQIKPNLYNNGKIRCYKPLENCPKPKTSRRLERLAWKKYNKKRERT